MAAARDGLALCGNVIIPSLFPFFVLSSLVVELGMSRYLGRLLEGVMAPLFRVSGRLRLRPRPGLCRGLPGGGPARPSPYTRTASAPRRRPSGCWPSATTQVPPLSWGWWGPGSSPAAGRGCSSIWPHVAASLCVGLLFRFYKPGRGTAGRDGHAGPPVPGSQLPRGLHPFHHRGPVRPP